MAVLKRFVIRLGMAIPGSLMVFIAAVFLSDGVNVFTTIYAVPGHPVHSLNLWVSCASAVVAAALWSVLAAKKDAIDKAVLSASENLTQREQRRTEMWNGIWLRTLAYVGGATACSLVALFILVLP